MNAPAFIADLQARGAVLEVDGACLRVTPAAILTDGDLETWRERKAEILELLESTPESGRTFEMFLHEVEKQKRPDGLVSATPRLCAVWRCAEDECGHALTLSGAARVTNNNRYNSNAKSEVTA